MECLRNTAAVCTALLLTVMSLFSCADPDGVVTGYMLGAAGRNDCIYTLPADETVTVTESEESVSETEAATTVISAEITVSATVAETVPDTEPPVDIEPSAVTIPESSELTDETEPAEQEAAVTDAELYEIPVIPIIIAESETDLPEAGDIQFINLSKTYRRGENVTVSVKGAPGAVYMLRVKYKSGYSEAAGLGEALCGDDGIANWSFRIGSNVNCEGFTPYFEVNGNGAEAIGYFTVAEQETESEALPTVQAVNTVMKLTDAKDEYKRNSNVVLTVCGLPDTAYTLKIKYKSGYSKAAGLGEKITDASGAASWSFRIGNATAGGEFSPYFEISGGGETLIHHFTITQ